MEYQPASSDRLTVTLNVGGTTDCSVIFNNFTTQVSTTRGITTANLVPLMNYIQIDINRGSTSYTSTLSNLTLNDVTSLGSFSPGATSPTRSHITGFHLGSGFKLSGTIFLSSSFGTCAGTCDVEIRFGTLPSQIVVNKTVSGLTPYTTWQFAGPKGTFNVPNIGGTSVITPLGSAAYTLSETVKPGFTASTTCTNGANGSNSVSVTPDAGATITCTFANTIAPVYSTITVTPAMTNGWASFEELSGSSTVTPIALDIQSVPAPIIGIGTLRFELTQTNVGKIYGAAILTGTKLSDLLVLTYSTYLEPGGQVPTIQIGWDDDATDANTGFRGRLLFAPNTPATGSWQSWNALSDNAGTWYSTSAGLCNLSGSGCTWSQVLSTYPNATIHGNPSIPYGFIGVKAGSGGTGVSYFDGLTIAANQYVVTYDFEPACNPYRVFNMNTGEGFCGIQAAIDDANTVAGNTISVTAGTYAELVDINKRLTVLGPNAGIDPNTGTRVAEAIIIPLGSDPLNGGFTGPIVVSLNAPDIVFDGFTVDGDNPALTSGVVFNGADVDAEFGIYGEATPNPKATVRNNIVKNIGEFAVWLTSFYGNSSGTSTLSNNKVDNVLGVYGQGLRIADNAWGDVRDNVVTRVRSGIVIENFSANSLAQTPVISGNAVSSMRIGIRHNLHYNYGTPGFTILYNQVQSYLQSPVITTGMPTSFQGIRVESIQQTVAVTVTDNVINGNRNVLTGGSYTRVEGLNVTNASATSPNILFQRNLVTNTLRGLYHETPASIRAINNTLDDNTTGVILEPGASLLITGTQISNGNIGILAQTTTTLTATKNLINNNANGVVNNSDPASVTLTRNDLSLNTASAISNTHAGTLAAECNWFGSNAGPGASVQGNVDANPWLVTSDLNGDCSLVTLVVQKVVSGVSTYVPWQFAGPSGIFTLPAAGGSFTLTNLYYGPTPITETARLGYVATSSCTNGASGSNVVTPILLGSSTVTCTFTNAITPVVTTETVKLSQLGTWLFVEEGPSGSGTFIAGPATPPLGAGSAQLTVNTTGRYILLTPTYTGTPLADITNLSYSTYVSAGNPSSTAPVLQLNVDYNLTDVITNWQGRLSFEPYMSGTVVQDAWQVWDALQGKWWASGAPGNTVCPQSAPCTWQQVLNAFPNAGIHPVYPGVQFRAGGPWAPGFTGHVDAFSMGVGADFITYDFEPEMPCTTTCYVDAVNGNDLFGGTTISNAKKTIQAAIDTVAISGTIRVLPGTYSETASNRYLFDNTGPYQFGLFFPDDKPGISVIGVTASDAPITSYAGALATINTNATNNFGPSGIFIEGDNITLRGLRIGTNSGGLNKTIEVLGDAFTLKDCDIADPEGSIYIGDFRFDTGTNTSHVKSYTIDGNRMDEGVSVDISSGAGFSGPVSGRQIINNVFNVGPTAFWPVISFNGSGTGVPWFVYSVGGAVIQGNTFSGSNVQYIRTRGDVDESQFDWTSYWNDNTYDKGVMVVIDPTPPYTPSVYTYTAGGYTFTNVSAIFATIQDGVDAANAGETVLIKSGIYTGTDNVVTINKQRLTLIGAGANSTIISRTVAGPASGILIAPAITGTNISNLAVVGFNQGGICGQSMNNNTVISGTQVFSNTASGGCQGGIHFTGPVINVTITGNEAAYNASRGIVIWDGFKQHITITNNIARNNNCCGIELQDGTASGVLMSGNTVYDNTDSGISATGLMAGAGPNVISNNTVRNNGRFGIEIKLPNGTGTSSGDGSILVISNTVELTAAIGVIKPGEDRDLAGIAAYRRAWVPGYNNVNIPVGVVIQGNTVSGYQQPSVSDGFGIAVEGIRMSVLSNTLSNNDVGAQVQAGHLPYDPNNFVINGDQSNLPDQYFGRGNSPVACGYTEAGNAFASNTVITRVVGVNNLGNLVTNVNTGEVFCTIQAAIDDANTVAGNTISVTAGVYTEAVTLNKSNLYLIGASGAASTTIVGPKSGAGNDTVLFSAPGVTLDGFTVTRDGNNPADWATNVRNQGVNLSSTGGTLKNSIITGNRNGVLLAVSGNTVESNDIVDNRTGIQVINVAGNFTVTTNNILNNWTVGVLFRQDASVGGNVIENNRLTGNWYSQLEDRGNPDGITRTLESNYWGDYPFTLTISNTSGEPSYLSQIPVQFGGSAVPPANTPVFVVNPYNPNPNGDPGGKGNLFTARLDYEPWLCNGTDTSLAIGFQPLTTTLCNSTPPDTFISSGPISPTASTTATFVFSGTDDVTPEALLTFECSLDGGAFSACSSPKNYTGLSDGLRTFAVRAVDPAGITDTTPATYNWFVDTTAPNTSITSGPISPTAEITSVFTFAGTDGSGTGVVSYECRLNGSAWGDCNSPITYTTGLTEGLNTFEVRASDAVSNTDATPATYSWTLDTTAPETTLTSTPAMTTSAPYATFAFTGTDGAGTGVVAFQCSLDGVTFTTCTSPQVYVGITNGPHTFAVRAIDAVGNIDPTPASFNWLVDLVAPVTSITSAPSSPTNTTSATLTFTCTDAGGSGIAYFEYRLDGGTWLSTTGTSVNYTGLSNGSHQFDVRAVDNVGNIDLTYASTVWTIDSVAPETTITSAPAAIVMTSTATFVFTRTDAGGTGVAYYEFTLDGGAPLTTTSTSLTFTSLSEGPHTFTVAAVDNVGNVDATPASANWTVDTAAPDTTITISPTTPTSSTTASIVFTGSDSGSGIASFMCSLDGATYETCSSPANLIGLSDGSHTFMVYAIDNVGNADPTPASTTWVVDATAPDTSITASPAPQTNTASATFVFTGTDVGTGVAGFECSLDAGAWTGCVSPKTYTGLSNGNHTFAVRAIDNVGYVDPTPASYSWLVDTTAPEAIITMAPASLISSTTASVIFTGTDGTGSGVAGFECQLDSGGFSACTSPITYTSLSDGLHLVNVRAIDNVGNVETSPASTAFTVDATPPTTTIDIAPPAIDGSDASISFSGGDGTGSGVAGFECKLDAGAWTACASPAAYLGLSGGSHTFEVRAVDNAGNVDTTPASTTWTVDSNLPNTTITSAPPAATSDVNATIVFTGSDATTPASALVFVCSFDGSVFAACTSPFTQSGLAQGTNTFQVRAIDEGNNVDTSPATVTWLVDTEAPDTTITSAPPAITSSNSAVITFIGTDALVPASSLTFECSVDGSAWVTCTSPLALIGLSNGSHTFSVRAIDTAGNVDATPASTTWTVDSTAPDTSIMTQPDDPTSETSATFTFSSTGSLSAVTYECQLDGGAWAACLTPYAVTSLSDGTHTLNVRATSSAGLTDATPASTTWVVDATAPDTTITAEPPAVSGNTVSFSFSGSDGSGSGVSSFECSLDGSAWTACNSPKSYTGLSNGDHTFAVRAIDNAGNVDATPASDEWTVDSSLPETVLLSTPPAVSPSSSASFTFVGTDDTESSSALTYECRLDGGAWTACTSPKSYTGLSDGSHTFEVRAKDTGGNVDPTLASYTWTVDTAAPNTTITSGPMTATFTTTASFVFTGTDALTTASDLAFECRVDGGAWSACSSPKVLTSLTVGTHVFEVRALDGAGNVDATPATYSWEVKPSDIVLTRRLYLPNIMQAAP